MRWVRYTERLRLRSNASGMSAIGDAFTADHKYRHLDYVDECHGWAPRGMCPASVMRCDSERS
jgi:hypothetical protein